MRKFERQIYIYIAAIVACIVPLATLGFLAMYRIVEEQRTLVSTNYQQLLFAERLRYIDTTVSALMPVFVLTGDERILPRIEERHKEFTELARRIRSTEPDPRTVAILDRVELLSRQAQIAAEPAIELRKQGARIEDINSYIESHSGPIAISLRDSLRNLIAKENEELEAARDRLTSALQRVIGTLAGLTVLSLILLGYVMRKLRLTMKSKRSEDEAQEQSLLEQRRIANARKEAVQVVAHDLKNPLGTIKMSLDMAMEEAEASSDTSPDLFEGLRIATRSADSMERLIRNVLDHAKIEAGQLVLDKSACDLGQLIDDLSERFLPLASAKGLRIEIDTVPGLQTECDPVRIEQVLSNLVCNALKFTPSGGLIRIEAQKNDGEIVISVRDSGVGMKAEHIPHIFDRFWQVRETEKLGTGLGLAISKSIVEAHDGKIAVQSAPGTGSCFTITLPRRGNAQAGRATRASAYNEWRSGYAPNSAAPDVP